VATILIMTISEGKRLAVTLVASSVLVAGSLIASNRFVSKTPDVEPVIPVSSSKPVSSSDSTNGMCHDSEKTNTLRSRVFSRIREHQGEIFDAHGAPYGAKVFVSVRVKIVDGVVDNTYATSKCRKANASEECTTKTLDPNPVLSDVGISGMDIGTKESCIHLTSMILGRD
jgi:hypothetical protein